MQQDNLLFSVLIVAEINNSHVYYQTLTSTEDPLKFFIWNETNKNPMIGNKLNVKALAKQGVDPNGDLKRL